MGWLVGRLVSWVGWCCCCIKFGDFSTRGTAEASRIIICLHVGLMIRFKDGEDSIDWFIENGESSKVCYLAEEVVDHNLGCTR